MAEIKTKQTNADVIEFINTFADTDQKRADSFELLKLDRKSVVVGKSVDLGGRRLI